MLTVTRVHVTTQGLYHLPRALAWVWRVDSPRLPALEMELWETQGWDTSKPRLSYSCLQLARTSASWPEKRG